METLERIQVKPGIIETIDELGENAAFGEETSNFDNRVCWLTAARVLVRVCDMSEDHLPPAKSPEAWAWGFNDPSDGVETIWLGFPTKQAAIDSAFDYRREELQDPD